MAAGVFIGAVASCDNEPKNPGDFSVKSELSVMEIISTTTGEVYNFKTSRSIDTVFKTGVQVWDTIYDSNGEYLDRTADTIWVPAKFTTKWIEIEPIILPSFADTFNISLATNAKWYSPEPTTTTAPWLYNVATTQGGGDGVVTIRSVRNRNFVRKTYTNVMIYTSDSTIMYNIPFGQKGEQDKD